MDNASSAGAAPSVAPTELNCLFDARFYQHVAPTELKFLHVEYSGLAFGPTDSCTAHCGCFSPLLCDVISMTDTTTTPAPISIWPVMDSPAISQPRITAIT